MYEEAHTVANWGLLPTAEWVKHVGTDRPAPLAPSAASHLDRSSTEIRTRTEQPSFSGICFGFNVYLCIFERQRDRERQRSPSRLSALSAQSLMRGLDLTDREIMTCAKIKSWTLNRLSRPGAPGISGAQNLWNNKCLLIRVPIWGGG